MMTFLFDTRPFVTSHMKQPRGFGSWAFSTDQTGDQVFFSPAMTLTQARKWLKTTVAAMAPASFNGTVVVKVLP